MDNSLQLVTLAAGAVIVAAIFTKKRRLRIAFVLVVCAVVFLPKLASLRARRSAQSNGGVLVPITLPPAARTSQSVASEFLQGITSDVAAIPGTVVAFISPSPLRSDTLSSALVTVSHAGKSVSAQYFIIGDDYFRSVGMPVLRGRLFAHADGADRTMVVIINALLRDRLWTGSEPIGNELMADLGRGSSVAMTIVGVVEDARAGPAAGRPTIYLPQTQHVIGDGLLVVRPIDGNSDIRPKLRTALRRALGDSINVIPLRELVSKL